MRLNAHARGRACSRSRQRYVGSARSGACAGQGSRGCGPWLGALHWAWWWPEGRTRQRMPAGPWLGHPGCINSPRAARRQTCRCSCGARGRGRWRAACHELHEYRQRRGHVSRVQPGQPQPRATRPLYSSRVVSPMHGRAALRQPERVGRGGGAAWRVGVSGCGARGSDHRLKRRAEEGGGECRGTALARTGAGTVPAALARPRAGAAAAGACQQLTEHSHQQQPSWPHPTARGTVSGAASR